MEMDDLYWPPAQADPENACRNMLPTACIVCKYTSVPCAELLIAHMSHVLGWFLHVSHIYLITWCVLVLSCGVQSIHHRINLRSSLLHRLTM